MKSLLSLAIILCSVMFCTSCTSVKTVVIDVQKPEEILLPPTISNIAIVNNAVPQPQSVGHVEYKYTKKGDKIKKNVSVQNDDACKTLTESLYTELSNINRFNTISYYEYPLRNDTSYTEILKIDTNTLQELFNKTNSDAIIALDRLTINTTSNTEPYDLGIDIDFLDINIEAYLSLYPKDISKEPSRFYLSDSIYWDAMYTSKNRQLLSKDTIPSMENALIESTSYIAEKIAKAFVPTWVSKLRVYYGDSKEANRNIEANEWEQARSTWESLYKVEQNTKKKARLASNIALGYEVADNLQDALKWAQTAVELFTQTTTTEIDKNNLQMAKDYYEELLTRLNDFRLLDSRNE